MSGFNQLENQLELNDIPLTPKQKGGQQQQEQQQYEEASEYVLPTSTTIIQTNPDSTSNTSSPATSVNLKKSSSQVTSKKPLSFSNDMWDGFDQLCKKTEIGIEQCKELLDFFKKRANIEEKYAKSISDYFSKFKFKDENDTFQKGVRFLNKLNDFENSIHKTFSQNLLNNLCHPFTALVREMENRRKNLVSEGQKLRNELKDHVEDLKKAHQKYEKHCKENEAAKIELISFVDNDPNSSKMNQIEKKITKCESNAIQAEEEYKNQLQITNDFITNNYHIRMIENLNEFEQFEAMRLQFMKSNIKNYFGLMMEVPSSMESEINSFLMKSIHIESVDPEEDLQHFIKSNSTPKKLIQLFQFEPYIDGKLIQMNKEMYNNQFGDQNADTTTTTSTTTATINSSANTTPIDDNVVTTISSTTTTAGPTPSATNSSTPSSPPLQKSIKENIFGLINNAKSSISNLKSSTTSAFSLVHSSSIPNPLNTAATSNEPSNSLSTSNSKIPNPSTVQQQKQQQFNRIFGVELEELIDRQKKDVETAEVPIILMAFVSTLIRLNALETEGLFSAMPSISLIQKEKQRLDQLGIIDPTSFNDVHMVATLFKHWLRDLSNPLISFAIYDEVLDTPENAWKIIESNSPVLHYKVLAYIIGFLSEFLEPELVVKSKITAQKLAAALAPVLIRSPNNLDPKSSIENSVKEVKVIEQLIIDTDWKKRKLDGSGGSSGSNPLRESSSSNEFLGSDSISSFSPSSFKNYFNNQNIQNNGSGNLTGSNSTNPNPPRNFSSISFGSNTDAYSTDDELSKEFVEC